ncbi:hypothetical protein AQ490_26035 [Wenjunlia vitaminophila]|uniref:Sirohydrochlorin ferrochelatase n=2 Tax=Wenjunlia vitaminophila TaxID=76728 RepID=A0A0T6LQ65_WENVI|nr:hypothetical protein AQ490_26035 [Wenjunlia vitaminophila]
MPRPRQPGRHRRPEPLSAPEGAPALVLAVPGPSCASARALAEELVSLVRADLPGLDARFGFLEAAGDEPDATLDQVLAQAPDAVVVPLLAGPDAEFLGRFRQVLTESQSSARLTEVLGPHPLLAEALHVRLSEAGLARADRARLFTVATAADGIILAVRGGEEALEAAGITGVLLAARLAVPVMTAALDVEGSVRHVAGQLRSSGAQRLAVAPCVIGPEVSPELLVGASTEAECAGAEALGAYSSVGKLVLNRYTSALGLDTAQLRAPAR